MQVTFLVPLLLLIASGAAASAACVGDCSFAGTCMQGQQCVCHPGWTGPTCAQLNNVTVPVQRSAGEMA